MKRTMFLFVLFFYLFSFQPTIFAAGSTTSGEKSVFDSFPKSEGKPSAPATKVVESESPSVFPLFIKFTLSFILVIGLLIALLRFLSKRSKQIQTSGLVLPLGGHVLGTNKSLQVLLIGQTIYIVGVGENITILRSITQGEEYQNLLESYENQGEGISPNWLTKDSIKGWNSVFRKHMQNMRKENGEE
ncbi:flagellar biosynthetic protein FliO [Neobacillus vireti]|uniref:Flagellar biosynthetic protein fliZ n=1 Tax=Neobacillus vireti LMG 21834 TaxID=1131730 RepID=A0AB94IQK5_9BACI|nr:flagellar biosynthetic protein FliO [Neobacillus vireti]ETI69340.1 flagellar biosynthetic protein fliZ [Neobacillus vireti LMG 21834]